jgi:hypothetical protein
MSEARLALIPRFARYERMAAGTNPAITRLRICRMANDISRNHRTVQQAAASGPDDCSGHDLIGLPSSRP